MLFSNSPVKNIVEKLNPFSQKNKISRLKFERKGDYKTFLKFIKDSTKEIEDIKIPDSEDKKRKGLMIGGGLLGLGLLAFAGRGKGDSGDDTGKLASTTGVVEKAISDTRKVTPDKKIRRDAKSGDDILDKFRVKRREDKKFKKLVDERRDKRKKFRKIQKQLGKDRLKSRQNLVNELIDEEKRFNVAAEESAKKSRRNKKIGSQLVELDLESGGDGKGRKINKQKIKSKVFTQGELDLDSGSGGKKINKQYKPKIGDDSTRNIAKNMTNRLDEISRQQKIESDTIKYSKNPDDDFIKFIGKSREDYDKLSGKEKQELKTIYDESKSSKRRTRATIDRSKFFEAPEVPKKITPKQLNNFDKFNRFSNRILNSPAAKFTTFLGGMFSNPKLMILKSLMEPTPLADGTLEGKPGVSVFSQQLMFDEDMAVNIFMPPEGRESMIPFSADVQLPSVSTPTEIQTGSNKIVVDYEFNTTEDLFFIKMAGS